MFPALRCSADGLVLFGGLLFQGIAGDEWTGWKVAWMATIRGRLMLGDRVFRSCGGRLNIQITQLLHRWQDGDLQARESLFEALYTDLVLVARNRLADQNGGTLQPAALVNESLLRLLGAEVDYKDRAHFIAVAALKMRSVLVDHLRARSADKRGGNLVQLTLSHAGELAGDEEQVHDVMALHQALSRLAELEPRAASMIELTYFGGMSRDEIAVVLGVSAPTVDRDLRFARAWLNRQLA